MKKINELFQNKYYQCILIRQAASFLSVSTLLLYTETHQLASSGDHFDLQHKTHWQCLRYLCLLSLILNLPIQGWLGSWFLKLTYFLLKQSLLPLAKTASIYILSFQTILKEANKPSKSGILKSSAPFLCGNSPMGFNKSYRYYN